MSWVVDGAPVASAALAALAAGASWRSVLHAQKVWRESREPDIHFQVLDPGGSTVLKIYNVGGGMAKGGAYIIKGGGECSQGYLADGFVPSQAKFRVSSNVDPGSEDFAVLVLYRTLDESSWYVNSEGAKVRVRKGTDGPNQSGEQMWRRAFPDWPSDASEVRVPSGAEREERVF